MCEVRHPGAGGGYEISPDRRTTHHRVWHLPCLHHIDLDVFGSVHRRGPEQRHPRDDAHRSAGIRSEHWLDDSDHDQRLRRVVHAGARDRARDRHHDLADRARRLHDLLHFPQSLPRLTARQALRTPPVSLTEQRSEEHTSELQSRENLVCRLLLEKKKKKSMYDSVLISNAL